MARDNNGAGTVVLAFVLGAVTGAAVALLMAPASGEEVRKMIGDKTREGVDKARQVADQGREVWNRQREGIATAIERGREAYQQARGVQPPGTPSGEGM